MASGNDRPAVASGADVGDALRRRNIPGTPQTVVVPVQQPQLDDKKKAKKVRARSLWSFIQLADAYRIANGPPHCMARGNICLELSAQLLTVSCPLGAFRPRRSQRMGMGHCPDRLHCPRILYPALQDRSLSHRNMGRSSVSRSPLVLAMLPLTKSHPTASESSAATT